MTDQKTGQQIERRALVISMWANLFMGVTGVICAVLSHSNAILVDGLFSTIGFTAAVVGRRISARAEDGPDRFRPFGYAADEAIFTTFRSLSLLGLMLFAMLSSIKHIWAYTQGHPPEEIVFGPVIFYFVVIGLTCVLLWLSHRRSWLAGGKRSEILKMEANGAAFDGLLTGAAGVGLLAMHFFSDGFLAPIAPVGDSIIVLILCAAVVGRYVFDFRAGLRELAGVTADPREIAIIRRAVRPVLAEDGGRLIDLSVMKMGRSYAVSAYYDPGRAVTAKLVDQLCLAMDRATQAVLPGSSVILIITECGRAWPEHMVRDFRLSGSLDDPDDVAGASHG
ncbi:cation transporter [Chachezhania antarctica]|uniref:cation transporter n=1 Tax=Chachezhania antarctica TaxID=2340860 RepID=UPI000EB07649|nr:cation transporter [Chachezhania antarctica]